MLRILTRYCCNCIKEKSSRSKHLRNSTEFEDIGEPGPIVRGIFEQIRDLPGWFNLDDCEHFSLLLSYQSAIGLSGDLFEIGSYHGRSTSVMAKHLRPGEKIVVCDAFESESDDPYENRPSTEKLLRNIRLLNPTFSQDDAVIHQCMSNDLQLGENQKFRFIHVDGGHSADQAYFDINLCATHLISGGVLVIDDYHHRDWPGVTTAVDRFVSERQDFSILADLNRHGAIGRKIYLLKT